MPIAHLKSVYGVSSEDKAYPASNLLSNSNKKWKCESPAPSPIYVILQFDGPTKITGIDIANEHSAFIEVFVGKNGWLPDKYQQILLSTSFMSATESRSSTSPNRVKCFAKAALDAALCEQQWDLIKVVCSQTFNKHVQYGLSFVKVHCADASSNKAEKTKCGSLLNLPAKNVFAQFKIRENTPESDDDVESSSSLFHKWKQSKTIDSEAKKTNAEPLSGAAAIRDASPSAHKLKKFTPAKATADTKKRESLTSKENETGEASSTKKRDRNRESLLYDDDDVSTSKPKLEKLIDKDRERIRLEQEEAKKKKKPVVNQSSSSRIEKKMEASAQKFKTFLDDSLPPKRIDKKTTDDLNTSLPSAGSTKTSAAPKADAKAPTPVQSNKRPGSPHSAVEQLSAKKARASTENTKPINYKPFGKLLEGVVIVISGIQNPERADIRDKAQKMGARYKPDWDSSCTHLICAFKNTPKYNAVLALGNNKIVNRNWVTECFSQKKRIPWRRYALGSKQRSQPDSEDEIHDQTLKPIGKISFENPPNHDDSTTEDVLNQYDLQVPKSPSIHGSGSDTETESSPKKVSQASSRGSFDVPDIYDVSTDEDAPKK